MKKKLLEVNRMNVFYDKTQVLWDLSLDVEESEIVMIGGSNGAGKSTFLKTISGLLKPQSGLIRFKGDRIEGLQAHTLVDRGISLIPEGGRVFPQMTVRDNLMLGCYLNKNDNSNKLRLNWVLELFPDLAKKENQYAHTLSGGQRQMLATGIGLMSQPQLLMIDEPSSGLAPFLVKHLLSMIKEIRNSGLTVLLVEQNVRAALNTADRGFILENGRIILEGTSKYLKNNEHVIKAYLGG